jgi:type IV pilus assembly protein PilX
MHCHEFPRESEVMSSSHFQGSARQHGIALFISLMILVIITLLGLSIARTQFAGERMAQNSLDHAMAVQAAEAALREAEDNIAQGQFTAFAANTNGLYTFSDATTSWYLGINWASPAANSTITYGSAPIPGPALSNFNLASKPVYIVEQLPGVVVAGQSLSNPVSTPVYRVTAYAVGGDSNTSALLQSIYR